MTTALLYDSISRNTGDIAIGIAGEQALAERGIASRTLDPFVETAEAPLLIGGGELIRDAGDDFYDRYRRPGSHILNAAGVWTSATDLDYLRAYHYVSARSEVEVEHLRTWAPDARLLPCTTTLLRSEHYEIPGLEAGEPVVGIHMVPHSLRLIDDLVERVNAIPHKKVFIPFTHYNADASFMRSLPFRWENTIVLDNLKPLELHSVIGQMSYVVVSSLHASIFAYSQGVGFGSIHQTKTANYFRDRGLDDFMIKDSASFVSIVDQLENGGFDGSKQLDADRQAVNTAYDEYARILGGAELESRPARTTSAARQQRASVLLAQADRVVADRDLAIAMVERRRDLANAMAERQREQSERVEAEVQDQLRRVTDEYSAFRRRRWVRAGESAGRILRGVRARLLRVLQRARGDRGGVGHID